MSEQIEQIGQTAAPEEDLLLPEGWTEGEDIFAGEAAGGGEDGDALPPREEPTETEISMRNSPKSGLTFLTKKRSVILFGICPTKTKRLPSFPPSAIKLQVLQTKIYPHADL